MRKRNGYYYNKNLYRRKYILLFIIILLFAVLFFRLFYVMIIDNDKYSKLLEELSYDVVFGESTPRGRILDRNYKVIVDNKAINNIVYKRDKGVSFKDMIKLAYDVSLGIDLDYYKVTDRAKREFYLYRLCTFQFVL